GEGAHELGQEGVACRDVEADAVVAHRRLDRVALLEGGDRLLGIARREGDEIASDRALQAVGRGEGDDLALVDDGDAGAVLSVGCWKTRPMERRTSLRCESTSKPLTVAEPAVGRSSVQSMLIVVVFPAPFGPRKPKTSA